MSKINCKGCSTPLESRVQGSKTLWMDSSGVHDCPTPVEFAPKEPRKPILEPKAPGGGIADIVSKLTEELVNSASADLAELRSAVEALDSKVADVEEVREELRRASEARVIHIVNPERPEPLNMGRQHYQFAELVSLLNCRRLNDGMHPNLWLTGAPGGFKTTAVLSAFTALGIPEEKRHVVSLSAQTSEAKLVGYRDANGRAVETVVQEVFTEGGGLLFDEIDNSNPNALTIVNAVMSNIVAGFASGTEKRHPDCHFVAAGNTKGQGANMRHIGRMTLDGATTNRYSFIHWFYDWSMTKDLLPERHHQFVELVRGISELLDSKDTQSLVSPRQAFDGVAFLEGGITLERVKELTLWSRMTVADKEACNQAGWR